MATSIIRKQSIAVAAAVLMAASGIASTAQAMPFAAAPASHVTTDNMVETVQVKRKRVPVAKARKRNNNAAATAAIVGIGVLGLAAAAAAAQSQPRRGQYYTDQWGNPVDAYGRPIYNQRPAQFYYEQPGYYQQPGYYEQPGYYRRPQVSAWERQEILARQRAQREAQREQIRREQRWAQEQQWRQQQVYQQQYRQAPVVRGGQVYVDPRYNAPVGRPQRGRFADEDGGGNRGN